MPIAMGFGGIFNPGESQPDPNDRGLTVPVTGRVVGCDFVAVFSRRGGDGRKC